MKWGGNMPNWKVHLEIGKRLNRYLKLDNKLYQEFLLGNILPDVNNGFIVNKINNKIDHYTTHFENDAGYKHHLLFLDKYKDKMNEPLYLGYYVHLFTDYLFNNNFYESKKRESLDKESLRIMKQHDFKLLDNQYIKNTISKEVIPNVLAKIAIDEVEITKEDLINVIDYLENTPLYCGKYQFYSLQELQNLLENVVNTIYEDIKSSFF